MCVGMPAIRGIGNRLEAQLVTQAVVSICEVKTLKLSTVSGIVDHHVETSYAAV